jgi:hypothetical protein
MTDGFWPTHPQQALQDRLALHQRLQAEIPHFEGPNIKRAQVDCVRPCPMHVQSGEVWTPADATRHNLAVEQPWRVAHAAARWKGNAR